MIVKLHRQFGDCAVLGLQTEQVMEVVCAAMKDLSVLRIEVLGDTAVCPLPRLPMARLGEALARQLADA